MRRWSSPRSPRPVVAAVGAAVILSLSAAACGSASDKDVSAGNPVGQGATKSGLSTTTSTTTAGGAAGGATGANGVITPASGTVPPVTGATDLSAAPTIGAGTGTPPTVLTGADLVTGTGAEATATSSSVTVQYVGAIFQTGKVFDSSWSRGQPATFSLSGVVPGFRDAIIGMKVGGRREVVIPPSLGYGSQSNGVIPANSTLVFVIDLLSVGS